MIKSMTGYGRAQEVILGRDITVEIRSVNHRYYEFSARVPRVYGYLEEKLKGYINGRISRGKVEVSVLIACSDTSDTLIEVNSKMVMGYVDALRKTARELHIQDDLTLSDVIRLPDIFSIKKQEADEEVIWRSVQIVADHAIRQFVKMRETEGAKLCDDILERAEAVGQLVSEVERLSPVTVENYRKKLETRLREMLEGSQIDEQRIVTEAAVFADKTAVAEETVRLKSHIRQLTDMLVLDEPVGRKLDFLIQEFNREANTIGSKAQDIAVTKVVVELKSEIEKIREQIQNIE
ncbi:MAG: YicC family protein [Ruminococcus sp.]|nr:YicC family protein [Ruminococcus sp.]